MPNDPESKPQRLIRPCSVALGVIGVPAKRWATKADLLVQLEKAKRFMDHCPVEGVTVRNCADEAGLSMHHFLRLFGETYGATPHRYLAHRRIREAKELLLKTQMSVSEIVVEVGFGSATALGRAFKAQEGRTPSEHRRAFSQFR